ncbi:MAG: hypothetical protein GXC73_05985 [Chitinophagaceae bacterium]|nr:hypothetical protein [Chitinophagaceae bacterium]
MYSEPELIRLLYTLADIQQWISDLTSAALTHVPHMGKKKLQKLDYYLSVAALVHILERHYPKIPRHPGAGKFCIPISSILDYIRQAKDCTQQKAYNHSGTYRILECDSIIGYDQHGNNTNCLTVFTDAKGNILTAFPGKYEPKEKTIETIEPTCAEELVGFA